MPQAGCSKASAGLDMQVKTRRMHILAAVRKAHGEMSLVGPLVRGKSRVAINPEQRSAPAPGIGQQVGTDVIERSGKVSNEPNRGLVRRSDELPLVGLKPFPLVIAFETSEKSEKF